MLFTKTLFVFLVAIFGTSLVPEGRTNGLVSAHSLSARSLDRYRKAMVPTTYDVPPEDKEFTPLTIGIWAGELYYRLPNAPFCTFVISEGMQNLTTYIPNPFYQKSMYGKELVPTIDDVFPKHDEFTPLTISIWLGNRYYWLPNGPLYLVVIKEGLLNVTGYIPNPFYRGSMYIPQ
uniref:Uncharacterized protein n=1 Tax=Glyptapanteles flavicoxis TaxID=463051 RepID=B7S8A6_9HYME|nr:conserved hypothetical protein [Glyptapanteles flavicoxis]